MLKHQLRFANVLSQAKEIEVIFTHCYLIFHPLELVSRYRDPQVKGPGPG